MRRYPHHLDAGSTTPLLVEHRGLWRLLRRPEAVAEGRENRRASRDRRNVRVKRSSRVVLRVADDFLRRPDRQARRAEVILDETADREQVIPLGVAQRTCRVEAKALG